MPIARFRPHFNELLYQSATLTSSDNSGVIANPLYDTGFARFPFMFAAYGAGITTDETLTLLLDFYPSLADTVLVGTITFEALTAGSLVDYESWPGDFTFVNVARDLVPMFPAMRFRWTLAGTTQSMSFAAYASFISLDA